MSSPPGAAESGWRISKYDPRLRDENGRFPAGDWVGAAQIGEEFDRGVLTLEEYLRVEDCYVQAALRLWAAAGQPPLQIRALEVSSPFGLPMQSAELADVGYADWRPVNGEHISDPGALAAMLRWCLRDLGWCELTGAGFALSVGYDYYLTVVTSGSTEVEQRAIAASGLFMEPVAIAPDAAPPTDFRILATRLEADVIDHATPLVRLSALAAAEVWRDDLPALAGYRQRRVDTALAAAINRHAPFAFDFGRFEYWLEIAD